VQDNKQGYSGLELYRAGRSGKARVARVLFWDASGQFFVETFNSDVALAIMEELIAETKRTIETK
jgi:hypothetical protein